MTPHNTARDPICPCRRGAASPPSPDQAGAGPPRAGQVSAEPCASGQSTVRRTRGAAAVALPSIALALVPKCPMCIAAYLAIGGGVGVSFTTAAHLRTALVWLCWGMLVLLAARVAMRFSGRSVVRSVRSWFTITLKPRFVSLLKSTLRSTFATRAIITLRQAL